MTNRVLELIEEASVRVHDMEAAGVDLTPEEDAVWEKLTVLIQEFRSK